MSDGLSSYVETLRAPVDAALRGWLGMPDHELTWELQTRDATPSLTVTLRSPAGDAIVLDVARSTLGARSFASGAGISMSYRRRPDGSDPFSEPLWQARLRTWGAALRSSKSVRELTGAIATIASYAGVQDFMYRQGPRPDQSPPEGQLRLGFRCNQDCGFCWQNREWAEPPAEMYFRWLNELAELGVVDLVISGGEPTLHRALPELVERATREHGMRVCLETNAIRLAKPDYLALLRGAGLTHVFVSLHSHDPSTSDSLTRAPGTFWRTVAGVDSCLAAGLDVTVNTVVVRENYAQLEALAQFVLDRFWQVDGASIGRVIFSHPSAAFDRTWFEEHAPPLDLVSPHLLRAVQLLETHRVQVECVGTCGFPPCIVAEAPSVLRSLRLDALAPYATAGHEYAPPCATCGARGVCIGLRSEYVAIHGHRGIRPLVDWPADPRS